MEPTDFSGVYHQMDGVSFFFFKRLSLLFVSLFRFSFLIFKNLVYFLSKLYT